MSVARADLAISTRWILPMTAPGEVLENHTLMVRDGRIVDILPTLRAAELYTATVNVDRSAHLLLPGLVNAYAQTTPAHQGLLRPESLADDALLRIAEMLISGTTCHCSIGYFPEVAARTAAEQGVRAVIGIPIAQSGSPWADNPGEYLTRALSFRDEYCGHPTIATAFAPHRPNAIDDATYRRIATLADELDACILMALHETRAEVTESIERHGARPIARLNDLGLLTPAFSAVHMTQANDADVALAQRGGISIILSPQSKLYTEGRPPPAAWLAAGLRLGVGSGAPGHCGGPDLWMELRLLALSSDSADASRRAWDALAAATCGGAAALGLEREIGTLEKGKWADLCCVDLRSPAMQWIGNTAPFDPATQLAFNGCRDLVNDVWVSGRQLLSDRDFTRLDWRTIADRVQARSNPPMSGGRP